MAETLTVQLRKKGTITLPAGLRRKYGLSEGDTFTLIDLGDGSFLMKPGTSIPAQLGDKIAEVMRQEGVTLEEMLQGLEEEREAYFRERYNFWDSADLEELAHVQGVSPLQKLEELRGDFWPEDEPVDDFLRAVRAWREQDLQRER